MKCWKRDTSLSDVVLSLSLLLIADPIEDAVNGYKLYACYLGTSPGKDCISVVFASFLQFPSSNPGYLIRIKSQKVPLIGKREKNPHF